MVHETIIAVCPLLRSVFPAVEILSHKIEKFLAPKFLPIMFNEFSVKDSIAFAEKIVYQYSKLFMGTLDVDSCFTNAS